MTRRTGRHRGEKAADQNIRPVFKKKKKKKLSIKVGRRGREHVELRALA